MLFHLQYTTCDHVLQRTVETGDLLRGQRREATLRVELRLPEDLVGVRVSDPRQKRLVLEQVADLAPRRTCTICKLPFAPREVARVRTERVETVDRARALAVVEHVHLAHALLVAIPEVNPVIAHQRKSGGSRDLRLSVGELEDAGEHRIDHDPSAIEIEHEELPAMTHAGEAAMRERRLDRMGGTQHERVADTDEDYLAANERLLETAAHDVEVGPLRHQSATARSHRGSGRSKRRAAQARQHFSCWRWNERTRGSPGTSGFHERSAKNPDIAANDASIASARRGKTSSYHASTRSGSGPSSARTPWAYAVTSNSAGPTLANGQSKIRRRSPCNRVLSERVSKWSKEKGGLVLASPSSSCRITGSTTSIHSRAWSSRPRASAATRPSSPLLESSRQKPANSWCCVRERPRGRVLPRVLLWNCAYERVARRAFADVQGGIVRGPRSSRSNTCQPIRLKDPKNRGAHGVISRDKRR